jgi:hypothetical protein
MTDKMCTISDTASAEDDRGCCFAAGTRILTARGEVPVEDLRPGDLVPALLSRRLAPVRWIGRRRIDLLTHPRAWNVAPVRVAAGAFGPDQPARDLLLSPEHAVLVENVLVPIRYLLNGVTVTQEVAPSVSYFHVELDAHDVLLAEGLPAESYRDTGNRAVFENAPGPVMLTADFASEALLEGGCAPVVVDGPVVVAAHARLAARAEALGHIRTTDPALRVLAGEGELSAWIEDGRWQVDLPAGTDTVWLASRSGMPAAFGLGGDGRRLGVALAALDLDGVPPPETAFGSGWYDAEPGGWRWTDGSASLATNGASRLCFTVVLTLPYWGNAPAVALPEAA